MSVSASAQRRRDFLRHAAALWPSCSLASSPGATLASSSARQGRPMQFEDVAQGARLRHKVYYGGQTSWKYILETTGCGIAFFDYDNDGWLDVFVVNGWRLEGFPEGENPSNHLYRNNRDGTFSDVTRSAGLMCSGWGQGVCIGDYDNDGFEDLFVTYWGQNVLYHNNGDGTFTDVSQRARVAGAARRWGTGCAFIDYDRDGYLDLFVTNYLIFDPKTAPQPDTGVYCDYMGLSVNCGPAGFPVEHNILYRNNGDGTFTEVTEQAGVKGSEGLYGLGVLAGDFNNDGWPDLYVAADGVPSQLFRNNGDGTFSNIAVVSGCAYNEDGMPQAGMGVAAGDYDCDGWLDFFKTNFSHQLSNLYHNNGDGTFTDLSSHAGTRASFKLLGWGCGFADFDNDGWPDIFECNGHVYPEIEQLRRDDITFRQRRVVYRNLGNGRFEDVSAKVGASILHSAVSRGCAFGDFDNDGDVDVLVSNINETPSLLRCDAPKNHHWIKVRTIGMESNRSGIGSRIKCVTGEHQQIDEVRSGGSFMSQSDLRVHFGLGTATKVDSLEIRWPNGRTETLRDLGVDQLIYIQEGKGITRTDDFGSQTRR